MLKTKKQGRPLYRDCLGYMGVSEQTTGASVCMGCWGCGGPSIRVIAGFSQCA